MKIAKMKPHYAGSKEREDFRIQILLLKVVLPVHPNASWNTDGKLPCTGISCLRSLTRSRELLVQNRTKLKNKIHHLLDTASIRLFSVLSDLFGKSGTIILQGLVQNKPLEEIIESLPKKNERPR